MISDNFGGHHHGMRDLSFPIRYQTHPLQKCRVLSTGPPGTSLRYFVLFQNHEAHKSFSICPRDKEKISRGFKPRNTDALLGVNSTS